MTPLDAIFEMLVDLVSWAGRFVPRLPAQWVAFVDSVVTDAQSLLANVPYSGLIPWGTVNAIAVGMPIVMGTALAMRMVLRVWAWVRSRGVSDQ